MRALLFVALIVLSGWNWNTHQAQIGSVYYSLPDHLKDMLNLSALEHGSIAPDKDFKDFTDHHFPKSYEKAVVWLERMNTYLKQNLTNEASYALGVASHYITDSYAAPHYVVESYKDHRKYEDQGSKQYSIVRCGTFDAPLREMLGIGQHERETWRPWLKSRNRKIPQEAIRKSTQALFASILMSLNATCSDNVTEYSEQTWRVNSFQTMLLALVIIAFFLFGRSVYLDLQRKSFIENDEHCDEDDEDEREKE